MSCVDRRKINYEIIFNKLRKYLIQNESKSKFVEQASDERYGIKTIGER